MLRDDESAKRHGADQGWILTTQFYGRAGRNGRRIGKQRATSRGHEMMIPLSSHRARRNPQSSTRHATGSSRVPYMNTALAFKLLPDDDGDELRGGKMGFFGPS